MPSLRHYITNKVVSEARTNLPSTRESTYADRDSVSIARARAGVCAASVSINQDELVLDPKRNERGYLPEAGERVCVFVEDNRSGTAAKDTLSARVLVSGQSVNDVAAILGSVSPIS